MAAMWVGI